MINIGTAAMDAFREDSAKQFPALVEAYLLEVCPDEMAFLRDPFERARLIDDGIRVACSKGFVQEREIAGFVALTVILGRDFDILPKWRHVAKALQGSAPNPLDRAFDALAESPLPQPDRRA